MARSSFDRKKQWPEGKAVADPAAPTFTLGTTKPSATFVGLAHPTTSILTGTQTYAGVGTVINDVRFDGFVNVTGQNITFNNCDFRGPAVFAAIDRGLVNNSATTCNDVIYNRCRFAPQTPTPALDGIFGWEFTLNQCEIYNTEDGVGIYNQLNTSANVFLNGNWVHDLLYSAPGQPLTPADGSHCDCVQLHNNPQDISMIGNRLESFVATNLGGWNATDYAYYPGRWGTSCVMYSPNATTLANVVVDRNWIDGGSTALNFGNWTTGSGLQVINNRWGRNFRNGEAFTIIAKSALTITITGNTYEDNGSSYNARQNG